jgi:hypothetical protein
MAPHDHEMQLRSPPVETAGPRPPMSVFGGLSCSSVALGHEHGVKGEAHPRRWSTSPAA